MPTNHETIFLYCFQYSIAAPAGVTSLSAVLDIYNNNGRDCKHIAHNLCHFRLSGAVACNEATVKIPLPFSRSLVALKEIIYENI